MKFIVRKIFFNIFKLNDDQIVLSGPAWLNSNVIDVSQKLICIEIVIQAYQSPINIQSYRATPYRNVNKDYIQLLHDKFDHWLLNFF